MSVIENRELLKAEWPIVNHNYQEYGKLSGWYLGKCIGLNMVEPLFIMDKKIEKVEKEQIFAKLNSSYLLCRPDKPILSKTYLPEGKDVALEDINDYFCEVRSYCSDAILLLIKPPSLLYNGSYQSRCKTDGGIVITVEYLTQVVIEVVGKGFDCGDITRGKTFHYSIVIPWGVFDGNIKSIYKFIKYGKTMKAISDDEYAASIVQRKKRLLSGELIFGYDNTICFDEIYFRKPAFTYDFFQLIYSNILVRVIISDIIKREKSISIMANIYGKNISIFEACPIARLNVI